MKISPAIPKIRNACVCAAKTYSPECLLALFALISALLFFPIAFETDYIWGEIPDIRGFRDILLAELTFPAFLLAFAGLFRRRFLCYLAAFSMLVSLLFLTVNIVLLKECSTYLTPDFFRILADSTDHTAMKAQFGALYPL